MDPRMDPSAIGQVSLETIPYSNRVPVPTSGDATPEYVNQSYSTLTSTEFFLKQHPVIVRDRIRNYHEQFVPSWWFNNGSYLPFEYQQPGGYYPDTATWLRDTRAIMQAYARKEYTPFERVTFTQTPAGWNSSTWLPYPRFV